jgi:energy-coupling factor transporter ATP-binding protein EcfA2
LTRPDGSHAGWTVIAGRNGSGKTTLLRAIALVVHGPRVALRLDLDNAAWITDGQEVGSSELRFVLDRKYDEQIPTQGSGVPVLKLEWSGDDLKVQLDFMPSRSPWTGDARGWFCAGYGPFRRLTGKFDRDRHDRAVRRLATLFDEEASLAEGVSWLVQQQLRVYEERDGARDLLNAVLGVLGDGLLPDGYQVDGVDSDGLWVVKGDRRFPLREMSDGYRTVTALVVDIINQIYDAFGELAFEGSVITAPSVVLIDAVRVEDGVFGPGLGTSA